MQEMLHAFYTVLVPLFFFISTSTYAHNAGNLTESTYDPMMHAHMFSLPIMIGFDGMVMYGIAYEHHSMSGMSHMDHTHDSDMRHSGMHQGVAWHFMPMISFGGDKLKKVIKLGHELCDETGCGDAYKIARSSHLDMGAGVMLMGLMPSHWFVHAGVMPMIGGDHYTEVHVNSYEKTKRKVGLKIPSSLSELDDWKIGDTLSYGTRGGVMGSAGVGFTIFSQASAMYMYQNIKRVKYQKVGSSLLKLDIARDHKNAEGFLAGTPLTFAMAHVLQQKQKINSMIFDFSQPSAIEKFRDFLSGKLDVRTAQSLRAGIHAMHTGKNKTRGSMANAIAGVPFLYQIERDIMSSHTKSHTEDFLPQSHSKGLSYTAMNASSKNTRGILSHHKRDHMMFMAMLTDLLDSGNHYMGSFKWFYENDKVSANSLKDKIYKISDFYGLMLPSLDHLYFQERAYVRAEIDIDFNNHTLDTILYKINTQSVTDTQNSLRTEVEQFFISDAHPTRICKHKQNCQQRVLDKTKKICAKIFFVANKIEAYRYNDKKTKLSKAIAELGKLLTKNRFILHYFTDKLFEAKVTLSVSGECFDPYKVILNAE